MCHVKRAYLGLAMTRKQAEAAVLAVREILHQMRRDGAHRKVISMRELEGAERRFEEALVELPELPSPDVPPAAPGQPLKRGLPLPYDVGEGDEVGEEGPRAMPELEA